MARGDGLTEIMGGMTGEEKEAKAAAQQRHLEELFVQMQAQKAAKLAAEEKEKKEDAEVCRIKILVFSVASHSMC